MRRVLTNIYFIWCGDSHYTLWFGASTLDPGLYSRSQGDNDAKITALIFAQTC